MDLVFEPFPENTPAGKAFLDGWTRFVETAHRGDVFWDPVGSRWETYESSKFTFARVQLPRVVPSSEYWAKRTMLHEVLNLGSASRVLNVHVIWNPRDGYWYAWTKVSDLPPVPGPIPPWLAQLNKDLAQVDQNPNLSPEERHVARSALISAAYSQPH